MKTKCLICGKGFDDLMVGCECNQDDRDYILINISFKTFGDDALLIISAFDKPSGEPIFKDSLDVSDMKEVDGFFMVDKVKSVCKLLSYNFKCLLNNQNGTYTFMADKRIKNGLC